MKLLVMADGPVGLRICQHLLDFFPADVATVVTVSHNDIQELAMRRGINALVYESDLRLRDQLRGEVDLGLLAWWPKILKQPLLGLPRKGFINTHPSLLPYNRGKHYNFWALVEEAPFGVTLHAVDAGIDTGEVIAQSTIAYDWTDTGETLYRKAQEAMVELFMHAYPSIRTDGMSRVKQDAQLASFHTASEMDKISRLELGKQYTARQLLNLLRARTFTGYPGCWFEDQGERYEVTVNVRKLER